MKQLSSLLVAAVALSGCLHTNTKLPGVLDLRSDGSSATPATDPIKPNEETTREGFGSYVSGTGLTSTGSAITIEDRNWWILGLVHIVNDMGDAEYKALPKGTALRGVHIGDSLSGTDIVLELVVSVAGAICPPISLINAAPHMTMTMTGTRIGGAGGGEPPPPTGTDPSTTTPPGT